MYLPGRFLLLFIVIITAPAAAAEREAIIEGANALAHAHIGGRPNVISVFEECIRYAKGFEDVWFCTKGEIAKWYLDRYVNKS